MKKAKNKNILAFDTSSPVLSVALFSEGKGLFEQKIEGFMKHAENLLPVIDQLLKTHHLTINAVSSFLIGIGPGSFTGLRLGFATLKGFLAIKEKPCYGAISLDMIAENVHLPDRSHLAVLLDARRGKIYSRFYERKTGQWKFRRRVQALTPDEIKKQLPDGCYLCGDALSRYGDTFKKNSNKEVHLLDENFWQPNASTMLRWYEEEPQKLKPLVKPTDFLPFYLRLSEAEERKKENAAHR